MLVSAQLSFIFFFSSFERAHHTLPVDVLTFRMHMFFLL